MKFRLYQILHVAAIVLLVMALIGNVAFFIGSDGSTSLLDNFKYTMPDRIKDARAMASASNYYGKYNQLDKDDQVDKGYDQIVVQPFTPTDDPTVIGLKPIPNVREKIKTTIQKYWHDEIEDVDYEPADFNEDDIFKIPKKIGGEE